jgi:DNA repair protein RecN (Recombination protein N)
MLRSLWISKFLLIDDTRIEFDSGLTVLTGETGAGKSIVVEALSLLLGERASSEIVRDGASEAILEAEFDIHPSHPDVPTIQCLLEEGGISYDDTQLLLKRCISREGRSRIFVNNSQCLVKKLKELGDYLIDLHGQHEHQSLLHKASYQPLLDRFGRYEDSKSAYREIYERWMEKRKRLDALDEDERERKRKEDMLKFQIEEIDAAKICVESDEKIEARLHVIQHAEKLAERCRDVLHTVSLGEEGPSLLDQLDRIVMTLVGMEKLDASIAGLAESWQTATIALRESTRELENYGDSLEFDPSELDLLQQRHFLLRDLKSKYGDTLADVLAYRDAIEGELMEIENADQERGRLVAEIAEVQAELIDQGRRLHSLREGIAQGVSKKVTQELQRLGMEKALFTIQVGYRFSSQGVDAGLSSPVLFGPDGADETEFLVTTIPDRPPRPLREVASGGEVSRIMLALKCVFGEADPVPMMVFDEIDVGVGGKTADVVGERLAALAKTKQVFCITHLPQIASRATRNLRVEKQEKDGRLQSTVRVLSEKEREEELARMLGGGGSVATRRLAKELLKSAK